MAISPRYGEIISSTTTGATRPTRTSSPPCTSRPPGTGPSDSLAEIEWLETLDKSSGVAIRYIGFADLAASGAGSVLDRLSEVRRCVGVRQMLSWHPTEPARSFAPRPGISDEPDFRRGVTLLARHDQILELMLYPYQAQEVARLARDFPDQTFIVNHCGSPIDRDSDGMARWREGLKLLGSAPNVNIKQTVRKLGLSGFLCALARG